MHCNPRAPDLTLVLVKCFLGLAPLTEILHHLAEEGALCASHFLNGESEGASSNSALGGAGFLPIHRRHVRSFHIFQRLFYLSNLCLESTVSLSPAHPTTHVPRNSRQQAKLSVSSAHPRIHVSHNMSSVRRAYLLPPMPAHAKQDPSQLA